MNLVCLDTQYLSCALLGRGASGQEQLVPSSKAFLEDLDKRRAVIVVPTPVICELLMEADPGERDNILEVIHNRFHVAEVTTLAAKYAADVWISKKRAGVIDQLRNGTQGVRQQLRVDALILGVALEQNVSTLYTQDQRFTKFADGTGVLIAKIPELMRQPQFPNAEGW